MSIWPHRRQQCRSCRALGLVVGQPRCDLRCRTWCSCLALAASMCPSSASDASGVRCLKTPQPQSLSTMICSTFVSGLRVRNPGKPSAHAAEFGQEAVWHGPRGNPQDRDPWPGTLRGALECSGRLAFFILAIVITSFCAGLFTSPFASCSGAARSSPSLQSPRLSTVRSGTSLRFRRE